VQTLRDVLTFVNEHTACTKAELVAGLAGADEAKMKETLVQLAWLVEKGHVIEYYNDVLSAPLEFPAFRFLPGEKQAGAPQQGPAGRRGEFAGSPAPQPAAAAQAAAQQPDPEAAAPECAGAEAAQPETAQAECAPAEPAVEAEAPAAAAE
jgi:hypothetical protein